jgi:hypothetical protein
MQYFETRPSPDLAPFVECMWELHGGGDTFSQPIFRTVASRSSFIWAIGLSCRTHPHRNPMSWWLAR